MESGTKNLLKIQQYQVCNIRFAILGKLSSSATVKIIESEGLQVWALAGIVVKEESAGTGTKQVKKADHARVMTTWACSPTTRMG